jgi:hypothetical protein
LENTEPRRRVGAWAVLGERGRERREKWRDKAGAIVYHLLEREHREIWLTLEVSWMLAWRDNDSLKS